MPNVSNTSPVESKKPSVPASAPTERKSFFGQMGPATYKTLNLTATAFATCTTVVAVETPLTAIVLRQLQKGTLLPVPSMAGRAGFFSVVSSLYAGVGAHAAGSFARATYVTTAKQTSMHPSSKAPTSVEVEGAHEPIPEGKSLPKLFSQQFGLVAAFAAGDVLITHPFDNKRHLTTMGITHKPCNWFGAHNAFKLCTAHVGVRYTSSLVNYAGLLLLEDKIASSMPFENRTLNHIASGAISGACAATACFPLGYYRDYALSKASVVNGQLITTKAMSVFSQFSGFVKNVGFRETLLQCFNVFKIQVPLRMTRSAIIFACVAGIAEAMGPEPLKDIIPEPSKSEANALGFFSGKSDKDSSATAPEAKEPPPSPLH